MKRIYLVRHGESIGNVDKSAYFKYHDSEIALTDKGKQDAINAADKISDINNHFRSMNLSPIVCKTYFNLIHSTYKRAEQTANIIAEALSESWTCSIQDIIASPLCVEREWGSLRDIVNMHLKTEEHFNFYYRPVNGESFFDVYKRAVIFHQWLLNTSKYNNTVIVAHGEFNKVYLMHLLNWGVAEFEKWQNAKNGEVFLIEGGELSSLTPLSKSKYVIQLSENSLNDTKRMKLPSIKSKI